MPPVGLRHPEPVTLRTLMEAATLHCPDCGAPVSADAHACEYCHARLATTRCPACSGPAFVGMRHCPACGAALKGEEPPDDSVALSCPACAGALRPIRLDAHRLRECEGCGGRWMDNRTFLALCRARDRPVVRSARPVPLAEPTRELPVAYLHCPVCHGLMNRVHFARVSGVVVDACREHGTWFGRGELERVMEFIDAGGFNLPQDGLPGLFSGAFAPFTPKGGW